MPKKIFDLKDYREWFSSLKDRIQSSQIKAAIIVNQELLKLYWDIGKMIVEKQSLAGWGDSVIESIARDLRVEFPSLKGFSRSNLFYMRQWFIFYSKIVPQFVGKNLKVPQLVGQIPWGHNRLIINKIKDPKEALFYVQKTIENNWSRDILAHQINSDLFKRTGKAITNFKKSIPLPYSDLAKQTLKDPYVFDFLTIEADVREKDLERQFLANITKFLLELGKGFAFVGNQFNLEVNGRDFSVDLLFYNLILRCYVVIDLKIGEFKPEYVGKMNFYLSAVDDKLKMKDDKQTIGIILCRERDKVIAEYALRDVNKPVGISEYRLTALIPKKLRNNLPSIEDLETTLSKNLQMNDKNKSKSQKKKNTSRRGDDK